jgi:signal transduction histidine kinase
VAEHGDVADDRLRSLLAADRAILAELEQAPVLTRIVRTALEVVSAEYASLAVVGDDGWLAEYVVADRTGERDTGTTCVARRTARVSVGVPVRVGDQPSGDLFVARESGEPFTARDVELLDLLADTAGVAIANSRLFTESRLRQDWLAASTEVTRRVLAGDDGALRMIAEHVHRLAAADLTSVVLPVETELLVVAAEGIAGKRIQGVRYTASGTLSEHVLQGGEPIRIADAKDPRNLEGTIYLEGQVEVGPVMVLPLLGRQDVRGTLVVMRAPSAKPFSQAEAALATTFASHASVALELAEARHDQQRVLLMEDRARIARDLHDHVIQQVFASGLVIQATAAQLDDPGAVAELRDVVHNLDDAIKQIRVSIFQLQPPVPGGLRAAVMDVVGDVRPGLGIDPRLDLDGPLDSVATPDLVSDVTAVVREALVNVARHAAARTVVLSIHATSTRLTITVSDDGVGVGDVDRRSGLENLRERAEGRHGSMVVAEVPDLGGTTLVWTVPIA